MTETTKENPRQEHAMATYLFHQGNNFRAYDYMGAHREGEETVFRVWAPNADAAFVTGDFCEWGDAYPMQRITEGGIYELWIPNPTLGDTFRYKFLLRRNGMDYYKADPYGRYSECPPGTASVFFDTDGFAWHDAGWMAYRASHFSAEPARPAPKKRAADKSAAAARPALSGKTKDVYAQPINIYEVHAGSWKRHEDGRYYSYTELAEDLAPYVKQMGYTHVELLPVMEHPFDGSWGYQVCGYYAPTARFGTPLDFMHFVDKMHSAGIGVILDWVPAHFPKDAHGLYEFDGAPLYEYQGADRMEHRGWGTRRFDVGRNEVECFLISNADFWARIYHADGLRVDAVASMLYLDYDKAPGEWIPNIYGDNRCLEAEAFFKKLNGHMRGAFPDVMMIAEESSAWPHVTGSPSEGLGFTMKWNMGWMNDTLDYISLDPVYRKFHHDKLTFSMMYAFGERYILPVSHDEVVHGKKSLLDRNPGDYDQKFAGDRALAGYMMTHPGKKLTFMGNEIGQFREWDYSGAIEWFLLDYEKHAKLQLYFAELNHFYLATPALWEQDDGWEGFQWIDADNRDDSVISYRRIARNGDELIAVIHFTPVRRENFCLFVPKAGQYQEVFNSDEARFGGTDVRNPAPLTARPMEGGRLPYAVSVTLPPLSAVFFVRKKPRRRS